MYGQGFDAGPLGNALHPVTSTESQPPPEVAVGDKRKAPSSELDHRERHERFELPPAAAVPEWIAALVARDGLEAVVNAVLKSAPRDRVMAVMEELCNQQLGVEPIVLHEDGQVSSCRLVMGSQPQLTRASLAGGPVGDYSTEEHRHAARPHGESHPRRRCCRGGCGL